ncbi:MAG: hypothetical protein SFU56_18660 [Capsulimonadales bacterium]|nr:hypothetical protein [Capsulimonadales bacterium]
MRNPDGESQERKPDITGGSGRSALFLRSPSPGAVFRFLERHPHAVPGPTVLLLSEPTPPGGWRLLTTESPSPPDLSLPGRALSDAFPPYVCLIFLGSERWGYTIWANGRTAEEASEPLPSSPGPVGFRLRLPGMRPPAPPYVAWGKERALPVDRFPAGGGRGSVPIVEYRTVSSLDERGLLLENQPRLYRFPFAGTSESE